MIGELTNNLYELICFGCCRWTLLGVSSNQGGLTFDNECSSEDKRVLFSVPFTNLGGQGENRVEEGITVAPSIPYQASRIPPTAVHTASGLCEGCASTPAPAQPPTRVMRRAGTTKATRYRQTFFTVSISPLWVNSTPIAVLALRLEKTSWLPGSKLGVGGFVSLIIRATPVEDIAVDSVNSAVLREMWPIRFSL